MTQVNKASTKGGIKWLNRRAPEVQLWRIFLLAFQTGASNLYFCKSEDELI